MKSFVQIKSGILLLILLLWGYGTACSQEVESNAVEFVLNNMSDTLPPDIKIIAPALVDGVRFRTDLKVMDLIGEVTDASKIRFVSVNTDIRLVNETGIDQATAEQLIKFAQMTRNLKGSGLEEGASTRLLVHAAKLIHSGIKPVVACRSCIAEALTDDAEMLAAVHELSASVF